MNIKNLWMPSASQINWVLPHPIWSALVKGAKAQMRSYILRNATDKSLLITAMGFKPDQDNRIRIVGGTCSVNSILPPHATATIDIEINPHTVGPIKQTLYIQHSKSRAVLSVIIEATVRAAPARKSKGSYLAAETWSMERQRRLIEQEGHRRLARVHAREHLQDPDQQRPSPEGELQNSILQNPWLDSQRFDGIDPNLNPEPPLNSEARREFDNERREQEMEKQLRLGHMPKMSTAPKPKPPG